MNTPSQNEETAVNACLTDDALRGALLDNDGNTAVQILENAPYNITFNNRRVAIDIINNHNWNDLRKLEKLLNAVGADGQVQPFSA